MVVYPMFQPMRVLAEKYSGSQFTALQSVRGRRNSQLPTMLASGTADMVVYGGEPSEAVKKQLARAFGGENFVRVERVGDYVVTVVVNKLVSKRTFTVEELRGVLSGEIENWSELGAADRPVVVVGPGIDSNAGDVLARSCLRGNRLTRKLVERHGRRAVQTAVSEIAGSIGFHLRDESQASAAVARVGVDRESACLPTHETIAFGHYPLADPVFLLAHREIFDETQDFVHYLLANDESASVLLEHSLFPESLRRILETKRRVEDERRGLGPETVCIGPRPALVPLRTLAPAYVEAEELLQFKYFIKPQFVATGEFTRTNTELLVLDTPFSTETITTHTPLWMKLNPRRVPLGRIGVAIVAHPSNKVDWLTIDELADLYTGRVQEWSEVRGNGGAAKRFGLREEKPVTQLLRELVLRGRRERRVVYEDTTDDVLKKVSADPLAIGYVSLGDLKPGETRVKVLGLVREGEDFPDKVDPETMEPAANYPLMQTWNLYVDPRAQPVTKRFAEFVESDHPAVVKTLRENGLIRVDESEPDDDPGKPVFVVPSEEDEE